MSRRYTVRYIYGRYEIYDESTDCCICQAYMSEQAEIICMAMNEQYIKDTNKEQNIKHE